jgi:hypothetical protein
MSCAFRNDLKIGPSQTTAYGGKFMSDFRRGIKNDDFLKALEKLAGAESWWRDVVTDPSLIIAIRDEYLNVYWQGQSIFKVTFFNGQVSAATHPKYLLNPDLSGQVSLIDNKFDLEKFEARMMVRSYEQGVTLAKLKKAAALYSGREKEGVHSIAMSNPSVIDVEIALSANGLPDVGMLPRIDLAVFEPADNGINLVFWEAKTFANPEIRSGAVVEQIKKYQTVIAAACSQIDESYKCVAGNLVRISCMSAGHRQLSDGIRQVARGESSLVISEANVGLIVYGFDADQRDKKGKLIKDKLAADLAELKINDKRIKFKGDPKGLRL